MVSFNLSPPLTGRSFCHDCKRYLRCHATTEQERENAGIPAEAVVVTCGLRDTETAPRGGEARRRSRGRVHGPDEGVLPHRVKR